MYSKTIEKDGVEYGVQSDKTLVIVNARNAKFTNLMIPREVQGMAVVKVDQNAFRHSRAKTVLFPDTMKQVGSCAFYCNATIKSVTFAAPKVAISEMAFCGCFKLQQVKAGEIHLLGRDTFSKCKNLQTLQGKLSGVIQTFAFCDCKRLEALTFSDNITIQDTAFHGCQCLQKFYFGNSAKLTPSILAFVRKRVIICPEDSELMELAYGGTTALNKE